MYKDTALNLTSLSLNKENVGLNENLIKKLLFKQIHTI